MIPFVKLGETKTPDGGVLTLWQRGDEFVIRAGNIELMSSKRHGSEDALAEIGCEALGKNARVLVGGLGLGFTVRAALDVLPAGGKVVVAELLPAVIEWVRGPLAHLADHPLDDPRVEVVTGDVMSLLRRSDAAFDAILLDVDNGPGAVVHRDNDGLYTPRGTGTIKRALRPGGRLVVWACRDDRAYVDRLGRSGFDASRVFAARHRSANGPDRGARHVLFVGKLPREALPRAVPTAPAAPRVPRAPKVRGATSPKRSSIRERRNKAAR